MKNLTTFNHLRHGLLALLAAGLLSACDVDWHQLLHQQEPVTVSPLAQRLGYSKERPLVMGMNTSYAPLQYVDDKGVPSGYDVEFTKLLMQRMGIPFTFSPNHWDKMSPGILSGKYDLGLLVYSSYRKELTNYSNAVFLMYYQILYRKQDYTGFDFRHLKGKKIAYMKSRPVGLMLKDAGADDYAVTNLDSAIIDLADGRYDGVICYRFQANYHVGLHHLYDRLQADELSMEPREYCYASFNTELIAAINDELQRMEEEGIIDEVYGQEVMAQFEVRIPTWVWLLLVVLTFVFLVVFSINRYLLSRRLLVANARAEESTRMKSNFIKQISHEIRTPLNILSGFTQILTSSAAASLSESDKKHISQQIVDSTDRITGLVNKMLELSDVSSQAVLERDDDVSARQIAEEAAAKAGIAKAAHLTFDVQLGEGADELFKTHQRSAVRILELLLDNAMKFTHQPEAYHATQAADQQKQRVTLRVSRADGHVRFEVEDTGIGVPAKEAERIFDEFVQLDEYYDGTGIGLTVARSLARRLGGDVVLDPAYTSGARFVMSL